MQRNILIALGNGKSKELDIYKLLCWHLAVVFGFSER